MELLSAENALFITLLLFAALVFWVLFASRAKVSGEIAAVTIVLAMTAILVGVGILLHLR